jgi:flagellin-specific chaperone FliS
MKKLLILVMTLTLSAAVDAQDIIGIVTEGITKVIRAVDLEVQRIQTKTIALQEAQKELENAMSALRLGQIHDWVAQLQELYANYFQELWQVKDVVSGYHKVAGIIQRQEQLLAGCEKAMQLFGQDGHFSAAEIAHLVDVYGGILTESAKNLDVLMKVVQPWVFQMTDRDRLALIDEAAAGMDRNYRDMQVYTNQNELIALQRASDENDYLTLKKLYGL